ncbi:MAG: hypothetical protein IVW57_14385 [Ktedonobacterales bacterium]|nr:hypothetical protein [Ktedonobacterales bacterium]
MSGLNVTTTAGKLEEMSEARSQSLLLIGLGVMSALIALTLNPSHGLGILGLGIGFLIAHYVDRKRLFISGVVTTTFAVAFVLTTYGAISMAALYGAFVLAGALSVGIVLYAARWGDVGESPLSLAAQLAVIGVLLFGFVNPAILATGFFTWFTSFWMPAVLLPLVGLIYLALSVSASGQAPHAQHGQAQ